MKITVAGILQNIESEAKKLAEGGEVICKSILHSPLPKVDANNLFVWYWISNSVTTTLGKVA